MSTNGFTDTDITVDHKMQGGQIHLRIFNGKIHRYTIIDAESLIVQHSAFGLTVEDVRRKMAAMRSK